MPEPTPAEAAEVMDQAAYLAAKAMVRAHVSGEPYVGFALMGRVAAEAVAPLIAERLARLVEASCPWPDGPQEHGPCDFQEAARIIREAFPEGRDG